MDAPADMMNDARAAMARIFGFAEFRPGQAEIVAAILHGQDVLAVMPTGRGKSLCFQLPAILGEGLTLVISPLIALMRDQVSQMRANGVAAASLNSADGPDASHETWSEIEAGRLKLLYMAPERLSAPGTADRLRRGGVARLAVDEAHCVSQWGHDFRPDYLKIRDFALDLGAPQTIAFTATADEAARRDIAERLFTRPAEIFVAGFDRPNIRLAVEPKAKGFQRIATFVAARPGESGIVYCASRKRCEDFAERLRARGVNALPYHAGLEAGTRSANQDRFVQEDGVVMAATIAFGMGVDKPDVRFVVHADLPKTMEAYYQEIGRAGRDDLPADALMLWSMSDAALRRRQIAESVMSEEQKQMERRRLDALLAYCAAPRCRRQILLAYFGDASEPCGNCDICDAPPDLIDGTELAQKAMSAVIRTGERFGVMHLIAILRGERTEKVERYGHDVLPTFGVGADLSSKEWGDVFRQLYAAGALAQPLDGHGEWTITAAGRDILRGKRSIELHRPRVSQRSREGRRATVDADLSGEARTLFDALRAKRAEIARRLAKPAYTVFSDRTLIDMASKRPRNRDEFGQVFGVGAAKLETYADVFLAVIGEAA